jgi:outer membrane receptor protein involved in Fe transport
MPRSWVVTLGLALLASDAVAQTSTTGALEIRTRDDRGEPLPGVTAVATSPALQGTQSCLTDERGACRITGLPPGSYLVTLYVGTAKIERIGLDVGLGQLVRVNQRIDPAAAAGEVIEVRGKAGTLDATSTNQGSRVSQDQLQNIPVPGRTFGAALGSAAGSAGDSQGVGFSGSTSLENSYVVDGVNTSSLSYGTIGSPLINEFIEEIQILTGGYQAEYGRSTGAVVNVVTKTGTNDLHGTAFATIVPYQVERTPVRQVGSSIDGTTDLLFSGDFGFDLGGPLIKDKLWFYVGFAPQIVYNNVDRVVQRRTDCRRVRADGTLSECDPGNMDGEPDEDPFTGDLLHEAVDRRSYYTTSQVYQFVGKLNYALTPEHQGQLSVTGAPTAGGGTFGVSGADSAMRVDYYAFTTDVAAKWTSKLDDNKTEVEALVGWHRDKYDQDALDDGALGLPATRVFLSNLGRFGAAGGESDRAIQGCRDSSAGGDPYPLIENCPFTSYNLDSPGFVLSNLEDRRSASLEVVRRAKVAGDHVLKAGVDVEDNRTADLRHLTGGALYQLIPDPSYFQVRVFRYVRPGEGDDVCGFDDADAPRQCDFLDRYTSRGQTLNWSTFAQDSWQILPNLTLNAGLRYEEQRLRYAEDQQDTIDPFTMEALGKNAMRLRGLFAPRIGLIYDPTREGRAKVYGSFGRFYESIPLALNDFSFSGTTLYGAFFDFDQCVGDSPSPDSAGVSPNPRDCPTRITADDRPGGGDSYRGGTTTVAPGTRAQYLDEVVVGGDWQVLEDLTLGVAFKRRSLGRVLEDVSIDNAETYIIGNPGYFDADEERKLEEQIDALEDGPERAELERRLAGFRVLRTYEKPRRDYHALELSGIKRLSRGFFVQASYTLSATRGNYPGLLNSDTGDALPNFSTQYDLPELLANRDGKLPQDRPHYLKADAFYVFDFEEDGELTCGIRYRAFSGTPIDALGGNAVYGLGESYVLPRGGSGRTPVVTATDLHVGYARKLPRGWRLSGFVDVINFFNQEQVASVDELYTTDNVNPIVGGDDTDLVFAKRLSDTGGETSEPLGHNVGYKTTTSRYVPLFVRFGARLEF